MKAESDMPVIFLTASGDEFSVVTGLDPVSYTHLDGAGQYFYRESETEGEGQPD